MKNVIKILLFLAVLSSIVYSQVLPDYKERSILKSKDSLSNYVNLYNASEGFIDPEEYKIGPGDKFFVSIRGIEETQLQSNVNFEGILYLPRIGSVDLNDLSLKDAKVKIEKLIRRYFKDVDIFISLSEFRKIKVSLIGDVKAPTTIVLSGNSRLMDLIVLSNGLNATANLRHIKIVDKKGGFKYYDFLSFLRNADYKSNPYLNVGDVVLVEKSDLTVSIYGLVKSFGTYEFVEGDEAAGLIKLSGGFCDNAITDSIEIIKFSSDNKTQESYYYSYDALVSQKVKLSKQDKIIVREKPDYLKDKIVKVNGFVKYPGVYKIVENKTTLKDILLQSGGLRETASLKDASLIRYTGSEEKDPEFERLKNVPRTEMTDDEYDYMKSKSRQRKGRVIVDMEAMMQKNNQSEAVVLRDGDVINVPEASNYVMLLGQVVNPGNIVYNKNMKYKDYIKLAGGFGWRAMEGDVRIIRANSGEWVNADDDIIIKPGDTIWIPEDPPGAKFWTVFTNIITVLGQVAAVVAASVAVIVATR